MDSAQKDTRDMIDVFVEALRGADRVIVETKNALGHMDAHILHAPEILRSWNTRSGDLIPRDEITPQIKWAILDAQLRAFERGRIDTPDEIDVAALTAIKESKDD